jgi:hypothetical protein
VPPLGAHALKERRLDQSIAVVGDAHRLVDNVLLKLSGAFLDFV